MSRTGIKYHWLLFLFSPFLAAIYSVCNFKSRISKDIVWAFTCFFGLTFAIGEESSGSDIVRYFEEVQLLYGTKFTLASSYEYFLSRNEADLARTTIAILVSRFTDSTLFLTTLYAFIFGFFFSRNIWFVLDQLRGKVKYGVIILIISLFLVVPIWQINGFRFWTGTHIFLYGALNYVSGKRLKYIWIAGLSLLFHFAAVIPVATLIGFHLIGVKKKLYFYFFLFSLAFGSLNLQQVNNLAIRILPGTYLDQTESYRSEDYKEKRVSSSKGKVWYARWYTKSLSYALTILLITTYFIKGIRFVRKSLLENLFCLSLLFLGVGNLLRGIPSGGRYMYLGFFLAIAFLTIFFQNYKQRTAMKLTYIFVLPGLFLFIIVSCRIGFYYFSVDTVFGNFLSAYFSAGDFISLNDVIK